jgi:hypothetical protein
MDQAKIEEEANAIGVRNIKRKADIPQANGRDYAAENERMGVKKEVDLIIDNVQRAEANMKYKKQLIGYSNTEG